ncbi:MAG: 2-phosphosulfolactate phosphatase [bacterium]|nr:2-phosphosulfolactate phosphatase [bacterium]
MKVNVYFTPAEINENNLRGSISVVIDVLRSSSSIIQALNNGCREIIPVETIERAISLRSNLFDTNVLLCGEKEGIKVAGFDLGNSPSDYTPENISGKTLIFTSTNAAATIVKARNSKKTYICGFQNLTRIVEQILTDALPVNFICAGFHDHFALEDTICAGMAVGLLKKESPREIELSDSAKAASSIAGLHTDDLKNSVRYSEHGRRLNELGFKKDIDFCIEIDIIPVLPLYSEGKIVTL